METIEERAKLASEGYEDDGYSSGLYMGYVEGATEQKAIDDAKWLKIKSSWEKQAQINHDDEANYKQGYHDAIEKACKWLEGYCCEIGCKYDCNFDDIMVDGPKRFRKAMEK